MAQSYYTPFTIASGQVTGTQTGFAALVYASDARFKTIANGGHVQTGNDIRPYSDSALTSPLTYEQEFYDGTNGIWIGWVNVSAVDSLVIYLGYGDAALSSDGSSSSTWDSNFVRVYHMQDNAGNATVHDSTGISNGTANRNTSTISTTGKIGNGLNFDGVSNDAIKPGAESGNGSGDWTFSFWVNNPDYSNYLFDSSSPRFVLDLGQSAGGSVLAFYDNTFWKSLSGSPSTGSFQHICFTFTAGGLATGYRNGASTGTDATYNPITSINATSALGNYFDGVTQPWTGVMDEFRLSKAARSTGWVSTEYNNQSAPNTFWTMGSESAVDSTLDKFTLQSAGGSLLLQSGGGLFLYHQSHVGTTNDLAATSAIAFSISAALTATGSLAATGAIAFTSSAALTISPNMTATGAVAWTTSAALTGAGTLAATGAIAFTSSAALTATGSLAATGAIAWTSSAAETATGTLAATGAIAFTASAALTATGDLVATGAIVWAVDNAFLNSPSIDDMSATGHIAWTTSADPSAIGSLAATGAVAFASTATDTAVGTLAATGALAVGSSASLTGAGTLAATGALAWTSSAALNGIGGVVATGALAIGSSAAPSAIGKLLATGAVAFGTAATISAVGTIAATGPVVWSTFATISNPGANDTSANAHITFGSSARFTIYDDIVAVAGLQFHWWADLTDGNLGPLGSVNNPGARSGSTGRSAVSGSIGRGVFSSSTVRDEVPTE